MDFSEQIAICVACLCTETHLFDLQDTDYSTNLLYCFHNISLILPPNMPMLICLQCRSILKKMKHFQEQVEASYHTLKEYFSQSDRKGLESISKSAKLTIYQTALSYPKIEMKAVENDIKKEENNEVIDESDVENFDFEVSMDFEVDKIKTEEFTDLEGDGLKMIEKTKSSSDHKKHKKSKRLQFSSKPYQDPTKTKDGRERIRKRNILDPKKIRTIILSAEDMQQERLTDALNENYLKLPFKCTDCIQGFDHEQTLSDHTERRHNAANGKYKCETCKSVLSSQASFSTHCRRHLLRFECMACGKRTMDKHAVMKHYENTHEVSTATYPCKQCGHVSVSYRTYRYHKEKHKERPQCEDCGRTFITKSGLTKHLLLVHKNDRTFSCHLCPRTYKGKSGLSMHLMTHDSGNKMAAYCVSCHIQFKTPYNYQHHLRSSKKHVTEDDFKFSCDNCDRKFLVLRQLRDHIDFVHLQKAKYICEKCDKSFKQRMGLERHRKYVHEKKRPPRNKMCHHCGRGFTTQAILEAHIRTHTGERPLKCTKCPSNFSHSAALYTHNKLLHADKNVS